MKKYIFIGNSIVNGFPFSRGKSFPGLIRAAVKEGRAGFAADIINKGENGNTTAEILLRFEHDVLRHDPAAVFIMTGTNDFIYREADPQQCFANLERMAEMAEASGITPVYLTPLAVDAEKAGHMWMAGMGIDYDRINEEIEELSESIRGSGRRFIDTGALWASYISGACRTGETETGGSDETETGGPGETEDAGPQSPADAYLDGVHPTAGGYRALSRFVIDWLQEHAEEL